MQPVSADWITAHKQNFLPASNVIIQVKAVDTAASSVYVTESEGVMDFSDGDICDMQGRNDPYVSLEENIWALDGTYPVYNNTIYSQQKHNEYRSANLSGADGTFATPITLTVHATGGGALPGLTIQWSKAFNQFPNAFDIEVKNSGTTVATASVTDNTSVVTHTALSGVTAWDTAIITITEWCLPYCFARCEFIWLGAVFEFESKDIMSFEHSQFGDMLSFQLPASQVSWEIDNHDGSWDILNPSGLTAFLSEREEVNVKYGYLIGKSYEYIPCGKFYLSEWDVPQNGNVARFVAVDAVQIMNVPFPRASIINKTPKAIAESVMARYGFGYDFTAIDDTHPTVFSDGALEEYTDAEVLQMCASASNCVIYVDRDGVITAKAYTPTTPDPDDDPNIDLFNSYEYSQIEMDAECKEVIENYGAGGAWTYAVSPKGITEEVSNPIIGAMGAGIGTVAQANAAWIGGVLANRKIARGQYRPDIRLDVFDTVTLTTKYGTMDICITSVKYSYNGAFKGEYEGREV